MKKKERIAELERRLDELRAGVGWVSGLVPVTPFDADVLGGHGSAILHGALT